MALSYDRAVIGGKLARFAVLLGALALALGPSPARAGDRTRIVILPIVVHSAANNPAYVSRGITDMISSRLEQTGRVQVERVDDPGAATTDLGKALEWGKARGGDFLIFGAFTQFGEGASLDVHCLPLTVRNEAEAAAARRIFIQSGAVGDIIPKIDDIVDRVAIYTKVARSENVASSSSSSSPPAAPAADSAPSADAALLSDIARRLDALEKAVFQKTGESSADKSGADTAAQGAAAPPES